MGEAADLGPSAASRPTAQGKTEELWPLRGGQPLRGEGCVFVRLRRTGRLWEIAGGEGDGEEGRNLEMIPLVLRASRNQARL